ncbi:hypothetical protein [Vibrio bivalvicida]|uniref:Fimbrial-type adhesion domain-containing protein n=1 Tax=Vibrio bivalvicida TaxID=1276888 RepID=A0A177Y268_9VIBR|nr:hypothetical protein [Vibrio bivalvicida]OAJ94696.1 hypothetical protein APB76_05275 [Vibrio bivalvicida]
MGKNTLKKRFHRLAIACYLVVWSSLAYCAQYTIPVGLLHYTPGVSGSYLFPQSGGGMPLCTENNAFAREYQISGTLQGPASWGYEGIVNQPVEVTLYEKTGNGTARIKISPLGTRKRTPGAFAGPGSVTGDTCAKDTNIFNLYGEKNIGALGEVKISHNPGLDISLYVTLAFELLDPQAVAPGYYSTRGGYLFRSQEIQLTADSYTGVKTTPLIPNLSMVVGHSFKIDMPYTSVALQPSYENDDTFTGQVRFRAQSNERYSITMTCSSPNSATSGGDCNFAGTQMELATQARFPEQVRTFDLQHGTPTYIDGVDFTGSYYDYQGYIDFTLNGVKQYGESGRTYFDTINLTFEADF